MNVKKKTLALPVRVVFLVFLAVGAFFLWAEHRAHLYGLLPYVLLLACPVMHLFMHHGHQVSPDNDTNNNGEIREVSSLSIGKDDAHASI
jgi:hypothetical protein